MKKLKFIISALAVLPIFILTNSCSEKIGVCTACCGPSDNTYYCKEWNEQKVNGLDWLFHEGQTCAERGTPATL